MGISLQDHAREISKIYAKHKKEIKRLSAEVSNLKEIEVAAVEASYLNGYHVGCCMCANCLLKLILDQHSTVLKRNQISVKRIDEPISGRQEIDPVNDVISFEEANIGSVTFEGKKYTSDSTQN